jgi:hypothetical protein
MSDLTGRLRALASYFAIEATFNPDWYLDEEYSEGAIVAHARYIAGMGNLALDLREAADLIDAGEQEHYVWMRNTIDEWLDSWLVKPKAEPKRWRSFSRSLGGER